ncbi:nucleotidyltransferase substrate binding protein [Candidatus Babeliales bacterium]|nr:nucleotidyltransferase substrate binding protein [Candidatus Babeliales bacterium]MCF7899749.1 nucleotidyltransferase substrate binding protein [Candidatus Babeliales bacterium]
MEDLSKRLKVLSGALSHFEEVLEIFRTLSTSDIIHMYIRDSVIIRFEFSVDIFWKCLKDYLEKEHKIIVVSPRSVFKECLNQKFIDAKELKILENMLCDRNDTPYTYDEGVAEEIAKHAYDYFDLMSDIKSKIK